MPNVSRDDVLFSTVSCYALAIAVLIFSIIGNTVFKLVQFDPFFYRIEGEVLKFATLAELKNVNTTTVFASMAQWAESQICQKIHQCCLSKFPSTVLHGTGPLLEPALLHGSEHFRGIDERPAKQFEESRRLPLRLASGRHYQFGLDASRPAMGARRTTDRR